MPDVSTIESAIRGTLEPIALIGTAALMMVVIPKIFQWLKNVAADEPLPNEWDEPYDDWEADAVFYDHRTDENVADYSAMCDACGVNTTDDYEIWPLDPPDSCPQCGELL